MQSWVRISFVFAQKVVVHSLKLFVDGSRSRAAAHPTVHSGGVSRVRDSGSKC